MKKYSLKQGKRISKIKCNVCGKELKVENGIVMEGVFSVDYNWGYFSGKDGEMHSFDICEECYDQIMKQFKIPVTSEENRELI